MRKKILIPLLGLIAFYAVLYVWNKEGNSIKKHPALYSTAVNPDEFLLEAKDYEDKHKHDKSAYSIEQAIRSIWQLEKDTDVKDLDRLELTIDKLEKVHRKILQDSIAPQDFLKSLEFALSNLAVIELELAESYSASNQIDEAHYALRYAQLHIKNALILEDSLLLDSEIVLLQHMDGLLNQEDISQPEYALSVTHLIEEVDQIIAAIDNN